VTRMIFRSSERAQRLVCGAGNGGCGGDRERGPRGLAQNAIGFTKGFAVCSGETGEYPTFSSERAARLKTTQAQKARERKRRQVADNELSVGVVLVCACDGGCRG
jgi:hypothetical protein